MPVRRVIHSGGNVIGKFPSLKMGRMIAFESLLERDFVYLLDYTAEVTWFEEQPFRLEYHKDGEIRHYTPDFHVTEDGAQVLVECKPERFEDTEINQHKFSIARRWCKQQGWRFRVVTEQIRMGFRLQNIQLLTGYARQAIFPIWRERIYALLRDAQEPLSIGDLASAISPDESDRGMDCILHMAFHHQLSLPLDAAPLSAATLAALPAWSGREVAQ
jgi:hypothetical protein